MSKSCIKCMNGSAGRRLSLHHLMIGNGALIYVLFNPNNKTPAQMQIEELHKRVRPAPELC
jgi:hypothetical protein